MVGHLLLDLFSKRVIFFVGVLDDPGLLVSVGLCMFVYALGLQFGKNFFKGLASPFGIKANILAAVGILAGAVVAVFAARFAGIAPDFAAGMFAGATASTPAMQAAM